MLDDVFLKGYVVKRSRILLPQFDEDAENIHLVLAGKDIIYGDVLL